jgi:lipid-A-disaccharide synthase-like uncharacterized protein
MNQLVGFLCFWLGFGMFIQLFLPDKIWNFALSAGLMLIGYYIFCQDKP